MRSIVRNFINRLKVRNKPKYFCIGRNKTGTTSLKKAFKDLGYVVGNQHNAEILIKDFEKGEYDSLIKYCKTAQVFQDIPFSFSGIHEVLDKEFPNSKYILTIRDSADQWYNSLVKFHSKKFGDGKLPTYNDLINSNYVWKGWIWECNQLNYKSPKEDPYNEKILKEHYEKHNQMIIEYFKNRPNDLLIINLSDNNAYSKFIKFIKVKTDFDNFPWENKT
ncbi:sulfotransferase [Marinigracilibium pacificum]|uniref:Sulfotransferase family protein n=1 Tax=Marinigracilibium pacificum TaxID=2729599 RepID=A0A848IXK9_9BACT|nr:sulfotransferase [Marinigracilibium pacificum]NMM48051.1 hypothetical protein [Marinigracilibium pacificum]